MVLYQQDFNAGMPGPPMTYAVYGVAGNPASAELEWEITNAAPAGFTNSLRFAVPPDRGWSQLNVDVTVPDEAIVEFWMWLEDRGGSGDLVSAGVDDGSLRTMAGTSDATLGWQKYIFNLPPGTWRIFWYLARNTDDLATVHHAHVTGILVSEGYDPAGSTFISSEPSPAGGSTFLDKVLVHTYEAQPSTRIVILSPSRVLAVTKPFSATTQDKWHPGLMAHGVEISESSIGPVVSTVSETLASVSDPLMTWRLRRITDSTALLLYTDQVANDVHEVMARVVSFDGVSVALGTPVVFGNDDDWPDYDIAVTSETTALLAWTPPKPIGGTLDLKIAALAINGMSLSITSHETRYVGIYGDVQLAKWTVDRAVLMFSLNGNDNRRTAVVNNAGEIVTLSDQVGTPFGPNHGLPSVGHLRDGLVAVHHGQSPYWSPRAAMINLVNDVPVWTRVAINVTNPFPQVQKWAIPAVDSLESIHWTGSSGGLTARSLKGLPNPSGVVYHFKDIPPIGMFSASAAGVPNMAQLQILTGYNSTVAMGGWHTQITAPDGLSLDYELWLAIAKKPGEILATHYRVRDDSALGGFIEAPFLISNNAGQPIHVIVYRKDPITGEPVAINLRDVSGSPYLANSPRTI